MNTLMLHLEYYSIKHENMNEEAISCLRRQHFLDHDDC